MGPHFDYKTHLSNHIPKWRTLPRPLTKKKEKKNQYGVFCITNTKSSIRSHDDYSHRRLRFHIHRPHHTTAKVLPTRSTWMAHHRQYVNDGSTHPPWFSKLS